MSMIPIHPKKYPYTLDLLLVFDYETKNEFKVDREWSYNQVIADTHKGMIGRYTIEGTYSSVVWSITWCHRMMILNDSQWATL